MPGLAQSHDGLDPTEDLFDSLPFALANGVASVARSRARQSAAKACLRCRHLRSFSQPGGAGKSHFAQAIGQAAILEVYLVSYRETHVLFDELADVVATARANPSWSRRPTCSY